MSDGLIIGNYNSFIHRYFSLLWLFGEKVVDKAIKDCNINNDNLLIKELSFFYFYNYQLHVFELNSPIERFERLLFKYKCSKICKKLIKSLTQVDYQTSKARPKPKILTEQKYIVSNSGNASFRL